MLFHSDATSLMLHLSSSRSLSTKYFEFGLRMWLKFFFVFINTEAKYSFKKLPISVNYKRVFGSLNGLILCFYFFSLATAKYSLWVSLQFAASLISSLRSDLTFFSVTHIFFLLMHPDVLNSLKVLSLSLIFIFLSEVSS